MYDLTIWEIVINPERIKNEDKGQCKTGNNVGTDRDDVRVYRGCHSWRCRAAVAPEFHFRLVKPVICPQDTRLEYKEGNTIPYRDTKGYVSNRTDVFISCIAQDGTRNEGKAFQGIVAVIGFYLLVFLAPAFLLSRLIVKRRYPEY